MTMPHMTGLDLYEKISSLRPDLPVILCTGFSESVNRKKAIGMGLADFIQKPIIMSDLVRSIKDILESQKK